MRLARFICLLFAGGLTACLSEGASAPDPMVDRPKAVRIVSLDYCADQYVLKLVDRDRILAVSKDATSGVSYMRNAAKGLPHVRAVAEDALSLQPDLIVRSHGGGPGTTEFFERAGIPVIQIGWAGDIDGIKRVIAEVGDALVETKKADALIQSMDQRLEALKTVRTEAQALYLTPSGTTTGAGSLSDEMIREAGLSNFETRPGWHTLSLERLTRETPDLIAAAFYDTENRPDQWSVMRHPIAKAELQHVPVVTLPSAWMACGGWFALDALEALNQAASDPTGLPTFENFSSGGSKL